MSSRSGAEIGAASAQRFLAWIAERDAAGDWDDYVRGDKLMRKEIATECDFGVPAFRQNPAIADLLAALELRLRTAGVFSGPTKADVSAEDPGLQAVDRRRAHAQRGADQRVKSLEEKNAALQAQIDRLEQEVRRYRMIADHLGETGRLLVL